MKGREGGEVFLARFAHALLSTTVENDIFLCAHSVGSLLVNNEAMLFIGEYLLCRPIV